MTRPVVSDSFKEIPFRAGDLVLYMGILSEDRPAIVLGLRWDQSLQRTRALIFDGFSVVETSNANMYIIQRLEDCM